MCALFTGFAITDGLFDIPDIVLPLGAFFANAYGILAFAVPLYFLWGAVLLMDPTYKPARIFAFGSSLVVFVTLAIGYNYFHQFDALSETSEFLQLTGRVGYICIILFCILIELIAILILNELLFQKENPDTAEAPLLDPHDHGVDPSHAKDSVPFQNTPSDKSRNIEFLTIINRGATVPEESIEKETRSSAAVDGAAAMVYGEDTIEIDLPTPKPLISAQAFNELKERLKKEKPKPVKSGNETADTHNSEQPAAYVDIPDIFNDDPAEITDNAVYPEKRREAESVEAYEQEEFPSTDHLSANSKEPHVQSETIPPSVMYIDIPIPFEYDPEDITDAADYPQKPTRPLYEPHDKKAQKEEAPPPPAAYIDLPEPFEYDPKDITDAADYPQKPTRPLYEPHDKKAQKEDAAPPPAAYIDLPEPFEYDPNEISDDYSEQFEQDTPEQDKEASASAPSAKRSPVLHAALPRKWKTYRIPILGILNEYPDGQYWIIDKATQEAAETLKKTLNEFKIQAEVTGIRKGPVITMFEILPAPGVKLSRIVNLQDNIALRLAAQSVRIVAPIPGKHAVGIEVPNVKRNIVSFAEIIEDRLQNEPDGKRLGIPVVLGKDITGEAQTIDLAQMPHLLIAGATGSGKSVCVNAMILSILYQRSPAEVRLMLIDPKIVELKLYNDIPHLLTPVITEPKKAFQALQYCICEMERRYACLDSMGVRDIKSYNKRIKERNIATEHMPYIVVVIDEFADLMVTTGKELESTVARLAAMSRAVGIHIVLATQRPSIDVITGLIKANIPSRIAFMVASKMDSRIIIDMVGAEKLLGKGDMLYAGIVDPFPVRMQGAFVSEDEIERVVEYVKSLGEPDYIDDEIFFDEDEGVESELFDGGEDPLYDKAWEIVVQQGKASASYIQRRLKIGYNRAARLVELMEQRGLVGPAQGSKPRELLKGV